jgi:hypothetical protein
MPDDRDIGPPDPLRLKVFQHDPSVSTEERLSALIELVVELDDRVKELENAFTNYVTRDL